MIAIWLGLALTMPARACHPIEDVRILGRDLAAVDSTFAGLSPDLFIGHAPVPGAQRVMREAELTRIAKSHGLDTTPSSALCFEWPMSRPGPTQMIAAMLRSPGLASAKIEIIDADRSLAPRGEMVFPITTLAQSSAVEPVNGNLWRGYIQYAPNRRFQIWARVKISVTTKRFVATRSLRSGESIAAEDIRMEDYQGHSYHGAVTRMEEIVGQTPRRAVRAGDVILRNLLEPRKDIRKGDEVEIFVDAGNVKFRGQGRAEAAGKRGDTISVRNPSSGKTFRAKVDAPGKVTVSLGSSE